MKKRDKQKPPQAGRQRGDENMEIIIKGKLSEIAAVVLAVQGRQLQQDISVNPYEVATALLNCSTSDNVTAIQDT